MEGLVEDRVKPESSKPESRMASLAVDEEVGVVGHTVTVTVLGEGTTKA